MKKIFCLILSAAMLFAGVSCQGSNGGWNDKESAPTDTLAPLESEMTPSQEGKLPPVLFSSYDDVLNTFSKIAKHGGKEAFEAGIPELDSREQEIYQRLCGITSQMLNTPKECTLHCSLLDIDGDGTEEMHAVALLEEEVCSLVPLEETETFFTLRGGVPTLDDGTLLECYRQMKQDETPPIKSIRDPLVTHPHYRMMRLDFQNEWTEKIEYEIYASDGTLVKTGDAKTSFGGYREGDLIEFSADARIFFYSISQNKFSKNDFPGFVEYSIVSQKAVYVRNGILTVQDIFDRNTYYKEFPAYQEPYSYYFAEDGKSLSFRHVVEGAKKDATSVICFEELPIIRATKICYVRTGPGTGHDILMLSSGTYSYLRSATQDTARLLQAEPIIGGPYESDNGTVRNDWYKISYYGRECYVSADSFEVELYRVTEDAPSQNENPDLAPSEAEIAMEMYEAVLKNEIKVYQTDIEEYNYLKDCKTPYNNIPLCELESLRYVYMDVDGDSINELVIDCGDTLILRYYEGTVYVYPFTFRNMYQLNTDGSYNWNQNGQNFEYGENQLTFDGAELKTKELWRIVNDGEPNSEFYIGDKQVTQKELLKYFEDNKKAKVEFLPLEVSWQKTISFEKALEIASEYWNIQSGDVDKETGYRFALLPKESNNENYRIALAWLVEGTHFSTIEIIEIDAFTGAVIIPTFEPDDKG